MKTILVVEDNNEIREEIKDIFLMENYNVIEASTGLEGFIKATNEIPDIIISDLMMPVLDGFKMYKELKKNSLTDNIPVIFLSALSSEDDIRKGMNLGADDYLTKPVNPDDLILATSSKLDKYALLDNKMNDMKISLTNSLYHELNTPLNGIIGFSDYLKTKAFELTRENIEQIADNIYNSGIRLNNLVKKYLLYAELKIKSTKISEIKQLRNSQYIETANIINDILISDLCKERETDFDISINATDLKIDPEHFKALIEEIIDNAMKFSKKGDKISIKSLKDKQNFSVKIKNQGVGLLPEQINNISDFCQFDKTKYAQNGSGIGLSIVKMITSIYNATFKIESVPNMFFSITLSFNSSFKSE